MCEIEKSLREIGKSLCEILKSLYEKLKLLYENEKLSCEIIITNRERKTALYPLLQSAYRKLHNTETALIKVQNDIFMNMDRQQVTLLVLLDLSTSFDTIDHQVLLNRLRLSFGICGYASEWIASYLSDRTQRVSFENLRVVICPVVYPKYQPRSAVIHNVCQ